MAGEIYIADKATLDEVHNKVGIIQDRVPSQVADKTTLDNVINKLTRVDDKLSSTVADKNTLDSINTKVNNIQNRVPSTVADKITLDSMNNKLDTIQNSVNSGLDFLKYSDISKFTITSSTYASSGTSHVLVNRNVPGYLYAMTFRNTTEGTTLRMNIEIDGNTMVYQASHSASTTGVSSGLVHSSLVYYSQYGPATLDGTAIGTISSIPGLNITMILPAPIRFEKSLVVTVTNPLTTTTGFKYVVAYILD